MLTYLYDMHNKFWSCSANDFWPFSKSNEVIRLFGYDLGKMVISCSRQSLKLLFQSWGMWFYLMKIIYTYIWIMLQSFMSYRGWELVRLQKDIWKMLWFGSKQALWPSPRAFSGRNLLWLEKNHSRQLSCFTLLMIRNG